jgi:formylglycine-generating enzyme required for sulfatase activity
MRRIARTPLPAFLAAGIGVVLVTGACGDESSSPDGSGLSTSGSGASPSGGKSTKGDQGGTPSLGGSAPNRGGTSGGGTPPSQGGKANGGRSGKAGPDGGAGSGGKGGASGGSSAVGGKLGSGGQSPKGGAGGSAGDASGGMGGSGGGLAGSGGGPAPNTEPPSCALSGPGRTTCGENEDESCCTSPLVEGGTYSRTYTNQGKGASGKADPATISTYRLDKYEVTVARMREYVKYLEAGGSPPAAGSGKHSYLNGGKGLADSGKVGSFEPGWDAAWNSRIPSGAGATAKWRANLKSGNCKTYGTWTDEPGKNDMLPLTCPSWYESYAFCIWDGGFLPSEAEWKYAAAGGDELRAYPWGSTDPGEDNEYAIYDCCYPNGQCSASSGRDTCTGVVNAAPVGFAAKGIGKYGQIDLVGNVWEWLVDRYADYVNPCEDCAYLTGNTNDRVMPGSGFHTGKSLGATLLYSYNRASISYDANSYRGDYAVGFRCARAP